MKRFLRFRLRTLFVAVTLLCLFLGWQVHAARRQAAAAEAIRRLGGWVYYDFQIVNDKFDPKGKSWTPAWMQRGLGIDFVHPVVTVNLVYNDDGPQRIENRQLTDEGLKHVAAFRGLEMLLLKGDQATDEGLRHLKGLRKLRRLYMWDAKKVSDQGISHLQSLRKMTYVHCGLGQLTDESLRIFGRMPNLEGLALQRNHFTDDGLAHLSGLTKLTSLWIGLGETKITDAGLRHLHGLKRLKTVDVQGSPVTADGMAELRSAIPNIRIVH
jgi:hypothetical protein